MMLLPGENSPKTWLFVTILVSTIIALAESTGPKTHSADFNPRAADEDTSSDSVSKKKANPQGSSESEDQEHGRDRERPKKEESSKENAKVAKSSNDSDDDDDEKTVSHEDKLRSTRGLRAADFEPEEDHPKLHGKYQKNSDSDALSDDGNRRRRRHINRLANSKR